MLGRIRTFLNLPGEQKLLFVETFLLVAGIETGLKTLKFKRTFRLLEKFLKKKPAAAKNVQSTITRHVNFMRMHEKTFPNFGKCLARSLAIWFMLKNLGIETDLRFGMMKKDGEFFAHSWLEHNSKVIFSTDSIEKYTSFDGSVLDGIAKDKN